MRTEPLNVGDQVKKSKTFTTKEVELFSELSGDANPIHLEEEFAAKTIFKQRIVHGSLVNSLFSNILGNELPGVGTIYCKQDSKFLKPVFIGDTVTAEVTVSHIDTEKNRVYLDTKAYNQNGDLVIAGTAMVLPPKGRVS
ncbi:MAG: MaoC family dehydratase [Candidatus Izemoplasmataceae bacterium]